MSKRFIIIEHMTLGFNRFLGSSRALIIGLFIIFIWALSYILKAKWRINIEEFVGMLSFLIIFIVQRGQNKDITAMHIKLDELIASSTRASNLLIKAEEAPEHVLEKMQEVYKDLAKVKDRSRNSITNTAIDEIMEKMDGETIQKQTIIDIDVKEE